MTEKIANVIYFVITILIAMLLSAMPLDEKYQGLNPEWALLVIIYWALKYQYNTFIITAFMLGLFMDILWHDFLGINALIYATIMFILCFFFKNLFRRSFFKQIRVIAILLLAKAFVIMLWVYFVHDYTISWKALTQVAVSVFVWPWLVLLLNIFTYYEKER